MDARIELERIKADRQRNRSLAREILDRWNAWDLDAEQQAQIDQSQETYVAVMLECIEACLNGES